MDRQLAQQRYFLKDSIRKAVNFAVTDQQRGVPAPPLQKPCAPDAHRTRLPGASSFRKLARTDVFSAVRARRSRRDFAPTPLSTHELAWLLWATQGVRERHGERVALRTVPSAGARHSFETYLAVHRVRDLAGPALYRYLPLEHELVLERTETSLPRLLVNACLGQQFVGAAAAVFVWTTIPYRMEWRYGLAAHRVIAMDAGHVCQNLYLACEAIGAGTCAVGAYDQEAMDRLLRVDGDDEFTIYLAPVGRPAAAE